MSLPVGAGAHGADARPGLHVPAKGGATTWFNGDILTVKLTAEQSSGALGLIEATCPPGGGPVPHVHPGTDETFYLIAGELEFLQGNQVFTAAAGDVVFIPRGMTHRFTNPGIQPARMIFIYTPGGAEGLFTEARPASARRTGPALGSRAHQ